MGKPFKVMIIGAGTGGTALRDAAALRRALAAIAGGEQDLLPALAAYERDMIDIISFCRS